MEQLEKIDNLKQKIDKVLNKGTRTQPELLDFKQLLT